MHIKVTSAHCMYRKCDDMPSICSKANSVLQTQLTFSHLGQCPPQLSSVIQAFDVYSFLHFAYAAQQVHRSFFFFFLVKHSHLSLSSPLCKVLSGCVHYRMFSTIPVLYSLDKVLENIPLFSLSNFIMSVSSPAS